MGFAIESFGKAFDNYNLGNDVDGSLAIADQNLAQHRIQTLEKHLVSSLSCRFKTVIDPNS